VKTGKHQQKKGGEKGFDWTQFGGQQGGFGQYHDGNPSDFSQSMFGNAGSRSGRRMNTKGQDYQTEMSLTLEDAYYGTSRVLQLK
jgi:curved DNA-binding protein